MAKSSSCRAAVRFGAAAFVFALAVVVPPERLVTGDGQREAQAADTSLALAEIASPPVEYGIDKATLRTTAESELRGVDASQLRKRGRILVSVAVGGASQAPFAFTVNALLRDAKTGKMLAILEGSARAESTGNAELRKQVLRAAVRSALRQIPEALSTK